MTTKIEWVRNSDGSKGETWNPVTGCTKISPGCANCYAERMARRLAGRCGYPEAPNHFDVTLHPDKLDQPLRWKKPRRVFVVSMGDLFHEDVSEEFIISVFARMIALDEHTYQVLTKRPARMNDIITRRMPGLEKWPNVWLGVTAENQEQADKRIPILLQTPAAVRFVSVEPMLGAVDLQDFLGYYYEAETVTDFDGDSFFKRPGNGLQFHDGLKLDQVICGGESGPGARPMHPDWARSLRDQCQEAGVPYFFKQWGEWSAQAMHVVNKSPGKHAFAKIEYPDYPSVLLARVGKKAAGRLLDGREWNEMPGEAR